MKILMLYSYPPNYSGLSTQGSLLQRGLINLGAEVRAAHYENVLEKEWYYRWFKPDLVLGIGYWANIPELVSHPMKFNILAVPWLVADGYIANYRAELNSLPLILVTSEWVKEVYIRDGIKSEIIEVLPVGCDTDLFVPRDYSEDSVATVRESLAVNPDDILVFTAGGDAASKGGREVMRALARLNGNVPSWKYILKVWPQPRTENQNFQDKELAQALGIINQVKFISGISSPMFMAHLLAACDIYAAPSRLEGFGMIQVEAAACGKPVIAIDAMGLRDTMVHEHTALLAKVAVENRITSTYLGPESGFPERRKLTFDPPRIADYRADIFDLADHLSRLIQDSQLRKNLGQAGRQRVVELFDYRVIARNFIGIITRRLSIR